MKAGQLRGRLAAWLASSQPLWAIAIVGIVFRVRANLEDRSLWLDESFLAVNFLDRDLWELVSTRLDNSQSAPPGFITLSWASFQLLGQSDFSVRAVPLIVGSMVPLVAVLVARSLLATRLAQLAFVTLVSFSPVLIYYSAEFKQYAIDVLATLVVLYWWAHWDRLKRSRWLYAIGAVLAVCSLTAVLMLVLLCLVLLWQGLKRDRGTHPWRHTFFGEFSPALIVTWSVAILLHFVQALLVTPAGFMLLWWGQQGGFAPLPTDSESLLWYPQSIIKIFHLGFTSSAAAGPGSDLGLPPVWIAGILLLAFAGFLRSKWLLLPALTFLAAYAMAVLHLYPLSSRLALYLLPLLYLVIALTLEPSNRIRYRTQLKLVALPMVILLATSLALSGYRWIAPIDYRDTKWALSAVAANSQPGQIIALNPGMVNQVTWYQAQGEPIPLPAVEIPWSWDEMRFTDLTALEKASGVWTLTALRPAADENELRGVLDSLGFVSVCEVFEDSTSVVLQVPVELAESRHWQCEFPKHN